MNTRTLRLFENLPFPKPDAQPLSWIIDTTSTPGTPGGYSPAGMWLRLAMGRPKRRSESALHDLKDFVYRTQGDLHTIAGFDRTISDEDIANVLVVKAVFVEKHSPFTMVTVWPGGRAEFWSGRYPERMLATSHVDMRPEGWDA